MAYSLFNTWSGWRRPRIDASRYSCKDVSLHDCRRSYELAARARNDLKAMAEIAELQYRSISAQLHHGKDMAKKHKMRELRCADSAGPFKVLRSQS